MAEKTTGFNRQSTKATLTSPMITSYSGEKCLTFFYQLNGDGQHKNLALSIYFRYSDGSTVNTIFAKGGHHSNQWKQGVLPIKGLKKQFQVRFLVFVFVISRNLKIYKEK